MLAAGRDPSTIRNALLPARALYRRAIGRGEVSINPTSGLALPAVRGTRDRIASPVEAAALVAALPEEQRAVWATALYAGLRLGELQALRDEDVDLQAGVIRVERSWTSGRGQSSRRATPAAGTLADRRRAQVAPRGSPAPPRRHRWLLLRQRRKAIQPGRGRRGGRQGVEGSGAPPRSACMRRATRARRSSSRPA